MSSAPLLIPLTNRPNSAAFAPLSSSFACSYGALTDDSRILSRQDATTSTSTSSEEYPDICIHHAPEPLHQVEAKKPCTTPLFIPFEDEQQLYKDTASVFKPSGDQSLPTTSPRHVESESLLDTLRNTKSSSLFSTESSSLYNASLPYSSSSKGFNLFKRTNASRIAACMYRSVLKVLYTALIAGLTFGVPSAVFDIFVRRIFRFKNSGDLSPPLRLIYFFIGGYVPGLVYYPAVALVQPILAGLVATFGQLSSFVQVRPGYAPLFWSEDLPEVLAFAASAAFFEFQSPHHLIVKGGLRSALGSALACIIGELYRHRSSSFRSDRTADLFSPDPAKKLTILSEQDLQHRNFSMGLTLGASNIFNITMDVPLRSIFGSSNGAQALIQAFNFFSMMVLYEFSKRFPGEPSRTLWSGEARQWALLSTRYILRSF